MWFVVYVGMCVCVCVCVCVRVCGRDCSQHLCGGCTVEPKLSLCDSSPLWARELVCVLALMQATVWIWLPPWTTAHAAILWAFQCGSGVLGTRVELYSAHFGRSCAPFSFVAADLDAYVELCSIDFLAELCSAGRHSCTRMFSKRV